MTTVLRTFGPEKRSKYGSVRTVVDGIIHDSKFESRRHSELKLLQRAKTIIGLRRQVRFELRVGATVIGAYIADFYFVEMIDGNSRGVVEDTKGFWTPLAKWKVKHFKAQFPHIEFREVRATSRPASTRRAAVVKEEGVIA